ncbi:hypothetical protein PRZ48_003309 [Zasmidium cellare]|uniref:Peptidase M12A domain-containing protein n=1 Tax=Zasmidium cellare TaxID=395010 RepID=A0ABR0EVY4_ZASCE|nr:hypothetical protein PRZ48_003309 [Zasmidium cellare]
MPLDENHFLRKRWYSVPADPGEGAQTDPFVYPWPVVCENPTIQPVYYCFRDERSAKNLQNVVNEAIKNWGHAMSVSALTFELDPRAKDNPYMPCSQLGGDDMDMLVISDESLDDPDLNKVKKHFNSGACGTSTTVGYTYKPKVSFRHHLKFCHLAPWMADKDTPYAIKAMTHELGTSDPITMDIIITDFVLRVGHALGLQHEHQRPDREKYLYVRFKYIDGYEEMEELAKEDPNNYFDVEEDEDEIPQAERVKAVLRDDIYLREYFPNALDFLAGHRMDTPEAKEKWQDYEFSQKFDFESIMMYSGDSGRNDYATKRNKYTITDHDNKPVWMGGAQGTKDYSVSEGDIARVAMLYDAHTDECEKAKKGEVWGKAGTAPRSLKVKIRDIFEGVVHAPLAVRKRDEI